MTTAAMKKLFGITASMFIMVTVAGCPSSVQEAEGPCPEPGMYQDPLSDWEVNGNDDKSLPEFTFPSVGNDDEKRVGWVYKPPPSGLDRATSVTMEFTISGPGTLVPYQDAVTDTPSVSLLVIQLGDDYLDAVEHDSYRLWVSRWNIPGPGTYIITAPLQVEPWIDSNDMTRTWQTTSNQTPTEDQFQTVMSCPYAVGFAFSGQSSAGHGLQAKDGDVTFTLNRYRFSMPSSPSGPTHTCQERNERCAEERDACLESAAEDGLRPSDCVQMYVHCRRDCPGEPSPPTSPPGPDSETPTPAPPADDDNQACLGDCEAERDACMEDVSAGEGMRPADCVRMYQICAAACN